MGAGGGSSTGEMQIIKRTKVGIPLNFIFNCYICLLSAGSRLVRALITGFYFKEEGDYDSSAITLMRVGHTRVGNWDGPGNKICISTISAWIITCILFVFGALLGEE